jgi:hypothetical protein
MTSYARSSCFRFFTARKIAGAGDITYDEILGLPAAHTKAALMKDARCAVIADAGKSRPSAHAANSFRASSGTDSPLSIRSARTRSANETACVLASASASP